MATAPTIVDVLVTPVFGNGAYCEVDAGPGSNRYVKGGIIKLPAGASYQVNFQLQAGQVPGLQFDRASPIWCSAGACPAGPANDPQVSNPRVDAAGTTLSVDATPAGARNVVHFSMNFANGARCDPIIING